MRDTHFRPSFHGTNRPSPIRPSINGPRMNGPRWGGVDGAGWRGLRASNRAFTHQNRILFGRIASNIDYKIAIKFAHTETIATASSGV